MSETKPPQPLLDPSRTGVVTTIKRTGSSLRTVYPCSMPREIVIDGLVIEDNHAPKDYHGPYLFTDPDGTKPPATRPFPYRMTEQVTIHNVTTASGKALRISPDADLTARVRVTGNNLNAQ